MESDALHIEVKQGGCTKVSLTFGASAAAYLDRFVPSSIQARLTEKGIDLAAISERARASGFSAGELFDWSDGEKTVRVWLA